MAGALSETVAIVTGGSRGLGKGIAVELGRAGATVYLTGRTTRETGSRWPGTIDDTAAAINAAGGTGIAVRCDHRDDADVERLFERVRRERGRLDILVNNVTGFGETPDGYPREEQPFWELPVAEWDEMQAIGLRSHFIASRHAAPMMIERGVGLIVNISSAGAAQYLFNAGYGVAKAALDKLSSDMAHDFAAHGVAVVSLWPPFTKTEKYQAQAGLDLAAARPPEFTGRVVVALAADPHVFDKTGQVLRVGALASAYGIPDGSSEAEHS